MANQVAEARESSNNDCGARTNTRHLRILGRHRDSESRPIADMVSTMATRRHRSDHAAGCQQRDGSCPGSHCCNTGAIRPQASRIKWVDGNRSPDATDEVPGLRQRTKKKARAVANALADVGTIATPEPIGHDLRCGLIFQSVRIAKRRALYSLHAFSSALNNSIDKSWFEATAKSDEEAEVQFQMEEFKREAAQPMRR